MRAGGGAGEPAGSPGRTRRCAAPEARSGLAGETRSPPHDRAEGEGGMTGITARGVTKRFGEFVALDAVSVEVRGGSLTALLGPSGSGKSTLLRVLAGLEAPDAGEVLIAEQDMTGRAPQDRGVGFVFQHYAAFKHMTVWDNVAFGLAVRKRPKPEISQRVAELLDLVQLNGLASRYPSQLSGG